MWRVALAPIHLVLLLSRLLLAIYAQQAATLLELVLQPPPTAAYAWLGCIHLLLVLFRLLHVRAAAQAFFPLQLVLPALQHAWRVLLEASLQLLLLLLPCPAFHV